MRTVLNTAPLDAPLLSIEDGAHYLRITPLALRKILAGRADGADAGLGAILRPMMFRLSPRRAYLKRTPFMEWLRKLAGEDVKPPDANS